MEIALGFEHDSPTILSVGRCLLTAEGLLGWITMQGLTQELDRSV
jgi:hypothetical protein